ncbi:PREDICTED: uncharacterized protein LOC109476835 [Branchiostoma belcheri]|uniref:Uncharacterized protein LOC109476835 n=1 Tax=Branchiostoma belcheri TaxID=7741 RepID=A0A6P4ZR44_BRABE|nr:PREDICTED: uncharacterized protein LOC109476835 [Branchiostoma belcheri]XP_019633413.1 PREDICTED: uncharacterized protein LOC109476835 [Branchiostoma belcheri]
MVFCTSCGTPIRPHVKFCGNCGTKTDAGGEAGDVFSSGMSSGGRGGTSTGIPTDMFAVPGTSMQGTGLNHLSAKRSTMNLQQACQSLFKPNSQVPVPGAGKPNYTYKPVHKKKQPKIDLSKRWLAKTYMLPTSATHPDVTAEHRFIEFLPQENPLRQIYNEFSGSSSSLKLKPFREWQFGRREGKGYANDLVMIPANDLDFVTFKQFYKGKTEVYCLGAEDEVDDDDDDDDLKGSEDELPDPNGSRYSIKNLSASTDHAWTKDQPEHERRESDNQSVTAISDDDEYNTEELQSPPHQVKTRSYKRKKDQPPPKGAGQKDGKLPKSSKSTRAAKEPEHLTKDDTVAVDELMESLSKFVGLTTLKAELETFAKSIYMKRLCGRQVGQQGLHMMFIGNPGTGKTTVATAVTGFLHKLQVISKPVPTIVQRGDLVSKYIGQTTEVTRNKIDQSRGGVMVVDEAYRLAQADTSSSKDVGKEALEELMSVMEDGDPIMIFAGYPEEMASFLEVNPGMKSRVAYRFHFHDFSVGELAEIMRFEIANMGLRLSPKADQDLPETIKKTTTKKQRSEMNGRLARQAVVGAEKNMYARCYPNDVDGCKTITQEDLDESLRTFLSGR